jgi:hypothetical protein
MFTNENPMHPRLGQSAGEQASLAELGGAVAGAGGRGFGHQIERPPRLGRTEQVERPLVEGVERAGLGRLVDQPPPLVELGLQQYVFLPDSFHHVDGNHGPIIDHATKTNELIFDESYEERGHSHG